MAEGITTAVAITLHAGVAAGAAQDALADLPKNILDFPLQSFDNGVFASELLNEDKLQTGFVNLNSKDETKFENNPEALLPKAAEAAPDALSEGTWQGTQLAITQMYNKVEYSYATLMDICDFEPSLPRPYTIEEKRNIFVFSDPGSDKFPPHLNLGDVNDTSNPTVQWSGANASQSQKATLSSAQLFNQLRLAQMSALLPALIPKKFLDQAKAKLGQGIATYNFGRMGTPDQGETLEEVEKYNRAQRSSGKTGFFGSKDIFDQPNVGDLSDWWSDQRFGQQQFTGTNPTTLERATDRWIDHFLGVATDDSDDQRMQQKISDIATSDKQSLYMQDYSYFRKAAGIKETDDIKCPFEEVPAGWFSKAVESNRWGTASVCLFHLQDNGLLQPLAIIIDWKGAMNSVTIFNKELKLEGQKQDWPWRFAKTCVQASDWLRHEVTVHLTNTHLIEEATIVAAQRSFLDTHPVFQLLYPHWQKTLSLNAAARATLVPRVIIELIGFTQDQARTFIQSEYENFDFKGRYVPRDLETRGFLPDNLGQPKYKNYAYAKCILSMWKKIRIYVEDMLSIHYKKGGKDADQAVKEDTAVKDWYTALQAPAGPRINDGAGMKHFPTITTFEELVNAVTMCIHLASPQHTAVNYLQNYYQSFVVNKPPCLYKAPPTTRKQLNDYKEKDLVAALPMNHTKEWLLASHIPYLLSFKPGDKESLIAYAVSKYRVYMGKHGEDDVKVKDAAEKFYQSLVASKQEFEDIADQVWDKDLVRYQVLTPEWNAVSILI